LKGPWDGIEYLVFRQPPKHGVVISPNDEDFVNPMAESPPAGGWMSILHISGQIFLR